MKDRRREDLVLNDIGTERRLFGNNGCRIACKGQRIGCIQERTPLKPADIQSAPEAETEVIVGLTDIDERTEIRFQPNTPTHPMQFDSDGDGAGDFAQLTPRPLDNHTGGLFTFS